MKNLLTRLEALEQMQAARPVYFKFVDRQGNSRRVNAFELEKVARDMFDYVSRELQGRNHTLPPEANALSLDTCYDLRDAIRDALKRITDRFTRQRLWFAYHYLKTLCLGFDYRGAYPRGMCADWGQMHIYWPIWGGILMIELKEDYAGDILLDMRLDHYTGDIDNVEIISVKYTDGDGKIVIDKRFEE